MVNNADGLVKLTKSNSMTCLRNIEAWLDLGVWAGREEEEGGHLLDGFHVRLSMTDRGIIHEPIEGRQSVSDGSTRCYTVGVHPQ